MQSRPAKRKYFLRLSATRRIGQMPAGDDGSLTAIPSVPKRPKNAVPPIQGSGLIMILRMWTSLPGS
jgi:hypothetical protein